MSHSDLQIILSAVEELNSSVELQTLPERALTAASKVIAADSVAFTGISYDGKYAGIGWENSEAISPADIEIFAEYMHEQPLFDAYIVKRRSETLQITDLISPEEFKRTNIYNEFYKRIGVESQLVAPLPISDELFMSCSVNTGRKDFSERDRLLLTLLKPHLINAIRSAFAYQRLESALETEACGIVAINSKGETAFVSEFAQQLFDRYFTKDKREANSLPETLCEWVKQSNSAVKTTEFDLPPKSLKIENQTGELIIRCAYNSTTREQTLLLEEKRFDSTKMFDSFGLTRRETEILFLMTKGKTDGVIAQLCGISLRTVHKHAENIYTKLGVETRTGAILRILEIK